MLFLRAENLKDSMEVLEYLKNRSLVKVFDFVKYVLNLLIINHDPKKKCMVKCVQNSLRKTEIHGTPAKKASQFFWFPVQDIKIQTSCTKSKTLFNERYFHYSNSSEGSFRLSALIEL